MHLSCTFLASPVIGLQETLLAIRRAKMMRESGQKPGKVKHSFVPRRKLKIKMIL
jgi:hypothetical protein